MWNQAMQWVELHSIMNCKQRKWIGFKMNISKHLAIKMFNLTNLWSNINLKVIYLVHMITNELILMDKANSMKEINSTKLLAKSHHTKLLKVRKIMTCQNKKNNKCLVKVLDQLFHSRVWGQSKEYMHKIKLHYKEKGVIHWVKVLKENLEIKNLWIKHRITGIHQDSKIKIMDYKLVTKMTFKI